jgi:hypothetical protein
MHGAASAAKIKTFTRKPPDELNTFSHSGSTAPTE